MPTMVTYTHCPEVTAPSSLIYYANCWYFLQQIFTTNIFYVKTIVYILCRKHFNTILNFGQTRQHGMLKKVWMV